MIREHRASDLVRVEPHVPLTPGAMVTTIQPIGDYEKLEGLGMVLTINDTQAMVWWSNAPKTVTDFDVATQALRAMRLKSIQEILDAEDKVFLEMVL